MKVSVRLEGFTAEQDQTVRTAIAGVLDGLFPEYSKTFEGVDQGKEYWQSQLNSGSVAVEALQGCVTGYAINPLESAIDQVVRLLREERESEAGQKGIKTVACQRLESHLNDLLALQLRTLKDDAGLGGSDAPKFEASFRGDSGPELEMTGPSRVFAPGKAAIEVRQYMDEVILSLKSINAAAEAAANAARAQEASSVRIA